MPDQSLTKSQVELLQLGLLLTHIPKFDLNTMEKDLDCIHSYFTFNLPIMILMKKKLNPHESLLKP